MPHCRGNSGLFANTLLQNTSLESTFHPIYGELDDGRSYENNSEPWHDKVIGRRRRLEGGFVLYILFGVETKKLNSI